MNGRLRTLESLLQVYQKEYNELQAKMAARPSQQLIDVGAQIGEMNSKLDTLLVGQTVIQNNQNSLRAELLSRFDHE